MKKIIGIILIIAGVAAFLIDTVSFSQEETVIDAGPIEVSRDKQETFTVPKVAGIIAVGAGVVLLVWGGKTGS
jgi:hypothetical protein